MTQNKGGHMGGQREGYGLDEASKLLNISKDALRKRIRRKTIDAEKNGRGEWVVFLEANKADTVQDKVDNQLIEIFKQQLEAKDIQISNLQKQNENMQVLMLGLQQQNQLLLEGSAENGSKEKRNFFFWNKSK